MLKKGKKQKPSISRGNITRRGNTTRQLIFVFIIVIFIFIIVILILILFFVILIFILFFDSV